MPYGSAWAARRGDVAKRSASEPLRGVLALPARSDHFFLATTRTISRHCLAQPHSLSYQATILTKLLSSVMPAVASNTLAQGSPLKSVETTFSSV